MINEVTISRPKLNSRGCALSARKSYTLLELCLRTAWRGPRSTCKCIVVRSSGYCFHMADRSWGRRGA